MLFYVFADVIHLKIAQIIVATATCFIVANCDPEGMCVGQDEMTMYLLTRIPNII